MYLSIYIYSSIDKYASSNLSLFIHIILRKVIKNDYAPSDSYYLGRCQSRTAARSLMVESSSGQKMTS